MDLREFSILKTFIKALRFRGDFMELDFNFIIRSLPDFFLSNSYHYKISNYIDYLIYFNWSNNRSGQIF